MNIKDIALIIAALIIATAGILFFEYYFVFTGNAPQVQAPSQVPK